MVKRGWGMLGREGPARRRSLPDWENGDRRPVRAPFDIKIRGARAPALDDARGLLTAASHRTSRPLSP